MIGQRPCELLRPRLRLVYIRDLCDYPERLWWFASYGDLHTIGASPDDALRRFDAAFSDAYMTSALPGEHYGAQVRVVLLRDRGALDGLKPERSDDPATPRLFTIHAVLLNPEEPPP
jgi:hypothetical protein